MFGTPPPLARQLTVVVALVCVGGCLGRDAAKVDDPLKLRNISITMEAGTNGDRPARVELVRVRDARLVPQLIAIDPADWFGAEGEAFRGANPKAVYDSWEPVPGLGSGPHDVRVRGKFAGVLFCKTREASPPLRVERDGSLTVVIDESGCRIDGGKYAESRAARGRRSKSVELSFAVTSQTNRNRPVRVELVQVDDADLVDALARLPGSAWFAESGRMFRRTHPDALVNDWELVPGSAYGPFRLAVNRKLQGVLFCGSTARGPLRVEWRHKIEVEIDNEGCRLSERVSNRRRWNPLTWSGWQ